jgi:L-lactate dehydrogenase complex protein LldF
MSQQKDQFLIDTERIAFDEQHRKIIDFNISRYDTAVVNGKKQYQDLELAKSRAARIKRNVVNDLESYLKEFEFNFQKNGGQLIWAVDAKEAIDAVLEIVRKNQVKRIVKSKSMVTEEIELNKHLQAFGAESLETDLGEYIVQIAGERPYHIVTPAMHKSKEDVAALYREKFNTPKEFSPEELTHYTRKKLREKFIQADMGITGANFLVADSGAIALTENEGNGVLTMSMPKIHVAIVGIEKLIPSVKDLDLFWSLLSTHGTGQNITAYNSIINGPRKSGEKDGPEQMYVILLDNGRTNLLEKEQQKLALSCIRCGACLNVCPVYKTIGGHAYETTYSGPIGAVIMPHLKGMADFGHLSFASTLCGKCTVECPVNIPLHELLLFNRRDFVAEGASDKNFGMVMKAYKIAMGKRWILETFSPRLKNIGMTLVFKKTWGPRRKLPKFQTSFTQRWKQEHKY